MSDRLPYEEQLTQQLQDLPLPDENMAWADMKRRLEKDDENGIIPLWLRGCSVWILVVFGLLALGWWLIYHEKSKTVEHAPVYTTNPVQKRQTESEAVNNRIDPDSTVKKSKQKRDENGTEKFTRNRTEFKDSSIRNVTINREEDSAGTARKKQELSCDNRANENTQTPVGVQQRAANPGKETVLIAKSKDEKVAEDTTTLGQEIKKPMESTGSVSKLVDTIVLQTKDEASGAPLIKVETHDSTKGSIDTVLKEAGEQNLKEVELTQDSTIPKKVYFGVGLSIHQQIPVAGQKLTPYNLQGRKGSLADYIPSVYLRMYKRDKWFLQAEFRYGAPQNTKEILYRQENVTDSLGGPQYIKVTSSRLKKTYYHQLPISFNYNINPNWSIGTGIIWNKFASAVYEEEILKRNIVLNQDSIIGKTIQREKLRSDSASSFTKNYLQSFFETQYRWKRLSFGARYSFGLQPFLKYKLSVLGSKEESSRLLQVFLRYELFSF